MDSRLVEKRTNNTDDERQEDFVERRNDITQDASRQSDVRVITLSASGYRLRQKARADVQAGRQAGRRRAGNAYNTRHRLRNEDKFVIGGGALAQSGRRDRRKRRQDRDRRRRDRHNRRQGRATSEGAAKRVAGKYADRRRKAREVRSRGSYQEQEEQQAGGVPDIKDEDEIERVEQ